MDKIPKRQYTVQINNGCTHFFQELNIYHIKNVLSTKSVFFTAAQNWQYWHQYQLCIPIYLLFPSLFVSYDVSEHELKCH